MKRNLNKIINRKNKNQYKWSNTADKDTISLGVADMDFRLPKVLIRKLKQRVNEAIFGYEFEGESYYESIVNWMRIKHGLIINEDWIIPTESVMTGIKTAIQAFSDVGSSIIIQPPVYCKYSEAIKNNNRIVVSNNLLLINNMYYIDFADFEKKIIKNKIKLCIFCNPHNPVGKSWSKEEIDRIADICIKNKVILLSDEIHQDFVFNTNFYSCLQCNTKINENLIVATSPNKTFNMGGIHVANFIIPNKDLRERFISIKNRNVSKSNNCLGMMLCEAAYRYGGSWHLKIKEYIYQNILIVKEHFKKYSNVRIVNSNSLYLLWIDCRDLKISYNQLKDLFNKIKVEVIWGDNFGFIGQGFFRINVACSKYLLIEALNRIDSELFKKGIF